MRGRPCTRCLVDMSFQIFLVTQIVFWIYICMDPAKTIVSTSGSERHIREVNEPIDNSGQPRLLETGNGLMDSKHIDTLEYLLDEVRRRPVANIPTNSEAASSVRNRNTDVWKMYFNPLLGHTILPRDPSVVTKGSYKKKSEHLCIQHIDLDLVVVVHSSPYNFHRRDRLRKAFNERRVVQPYTVQLAFIMGTVNASKVHALDEVALQKEYEKYGDIVQMDFTEDFRNLSLKAVLWLRWTHEHCHNAMMVLKIDDDVVLDLRRVLPLARGYFSKFKRSLFCNLNKVGSQPIPRIGRTKVDMREFAGVTIYPYNYCSGFIVFMSRDLITAMADAVPRTPFYNVDDVFMFGMVPKMVGDVTYHNIGYNVSIWNRKVYNCTVAMGSSCPYFGTMADKQEDYDLLISAMDRGHARDFYFPQMKVHR